MKKCVVIGGGIIGLSTAYYLNKAGHQVVVYDKSSQDKGASYVNAGYITPSHFIPLAAPGMVGKGLKYMWNSSSPFYIKPRWDKDLISWAWNFYKASNRGHVDKSVGPLFEMNLLSRDLYREMITEMQIKTQYDTKGLMMYVQTEQGKKHEMEVARRAKSEFDIDTKFYSSEEIQEQFEPDIKLDIIGGIHYPSDRQMTPVDFMQQLRSYLIKQGVEIHRGVGVRDIVVERGKIHKIYTDTEEVRGDHFVLAAGCWTKTLAQKLGVDLKIEAGKGYKIDVAQKTGIRMSAILVERSMAVSPMDGYTRFAGTMELSGINHKLRFERIRALKSGAESFYKDLSISEKALSEAQCGLRPVSADGLPYVGKSKCCKNAYIASGHAMMGWSLGPATGKLIQELIDEEKTSMALDAFRLSR